jgi:hypothetical protein
MRAIFFALACLGFTFCAKVPTENDSGEKTSGNLSTPVPQTSFERPPFIALVSSVSYKDRRFALIGAHSKPEAAIPEANWLDDVWEYSSSYFGVSSGAILGDLNLGCDYASSEQMATLDLRTSTKFRWLIADDADTNTADTKCAYDRIIVTGDLFPSYMVGTVGTENIKYSDHYPVSTEVGGIKFAAFNAKVYGEAKSSDDLAVTEVANLVCSSEITLVQEIVGESSAPIEILLSKINSICGPDYKVELSEPVGSTSYKERFAYFYNGSKIIIETAQLFPQTEINSATGNEDELNEKENTTPESPSGSQETAKTEVNASPPECGISPYKTPKGYCYATKDGVKKRVADSCCAEQ